MIKHERYIGQRRALRLVDKNNAVLNEHTYSYGVDAEGVQKLREDLEKKQDGWAQSGFLAGEDHLRIIDIEAPIHH
jgi:hypothetical protein